MENANNLFLQAQVNNKYLVALKVLEQQDDLKGLFKFNLFTNSVEYTTTPAFDASRKNGDTLQDNDLIELRSYIANKLIKDVSKQNLYDAVLHEALKKKYHPIKAYIEATKWDGVTRMDEWLFNICGVEKNAYTLAVSRIIILASIARIYQPGIQFDYLTILEGLEGIKKSTLIRKLSGDEYFSTLSFREDDKAMVEKMRGKWFLEIAEMQGFNKADNERVKAFISCRTDRIRVSYGVLAQDFPRQCIFMGTKNPSGDNQYFSDDGRNRRYWPLVCHGKIKINMLEQWRDQLFAEGLAYYRKVEAKLNDELYLSNEEAENIANEEVSERKMMDMWEDRIWRWLQEKKREISPRITVYQIADECLKIPVERMTRSTSTRVGVILRKSNWIKQRVGNEGREVYYIPRENFDQITWDGSKNDTEGMASQV